MNIKKGLAWCCNRFLQPYLKLFPNFSPEKIILWLCMLLTGLGLIANTAQATITARVTINTYAAFVAQNTTPGQIMFMRSSIPNAGNNWEEVANGNMARLDITGNVTNASVNLGTTPGYFTTVFNNGNFSQATGCVTSPIDFSNSTSNLPDGSTFDVTRL